MTFGQEKTHLCFEIRRHKYASITQTITAVKEEYNSWEFAPLTFPTTLLPNHQAISRIDLNIPYVRYKWPIN